MSQQKQQRIAIFIPSLRGGGAERVMTTLANGFAAHQFPVDLVTAKAQGPYKKHVTPAVRLIDLNADRVLFSLPGLTRYLRQERPDVLLSALSHANIIALWARYLANTRTRIIISERNTLSAAQTKARLGRFRLLPWLMRKNYRHADGIIAVSHGVADDLAQTIDLPRHRIKVVYNPVTLNQNTESDINTIPHPWFSENSIPVILAAGRLTIAKDFATLLHAVAKVRKMRKIRLVVLGEGGLREKLETLASQLDLSEDALFPGFVDNPQAWMQASSLFALSSAWEGLPNVLIEAMACGLPVVSTDCPSGPREILEHGKWGRLVPVGDIDALTTALLATLDDPHPPKTSIRASDFNLQHAMTGYLRIMGISFDG